MPVGRGGDRECLEEEREDSRVEEASSVDISELACR